LYDSAALCNERTKWCYDKVKNSCSHNEKCKEEGNTLYDTQELCDNETKRCYEPDNTCSQNKNCINEGKTFYDTSELCDNETKRCYDFSKNSCSNNKNCIKDGKTFYSSAKLCNLSSTYNITLESEGFELELFNDNTIVYRSTKMGNEFLYIKTGNNDVNIKIYIRKNDGSECDSDGFPTKLLKSTKYTLMFLPRGSSTASIIMNASGNKKIINKTTCIDYNFFVEFIE
jgi:hypothetical protein